MSLQLVLLPEESSSLPSVSVSDSGLPAGLSLPRRGFSHSGVLLWRLYFMKSSHGEAAEPAGLRVICLVSDTAILNCAHDASLRMIFDRFLMRE